MSIEKEVFDVELLDIISSNTNVVCEENGEWKRLNIFGTDFYNHALNNKGIEVKGDGETPIFVKIITDPAGHVIGCTKVTAEDITSLGIAKTDTTYAPATQEAAGLLSPDDKKKLDNIEARANNYTHPSHNATASGLYKITVDEEGHIVSTTKVTKNDIINLGFTDTGMSYANATDTQDGLMSADDKVKLDNIEEDANNYTHPEYNNRASGLYKVTVENGHIKSTASVLKKDITDLGIPEQDTTYGPGGDELGLVKNGGNVTINPDGTMTAQECAIGGEKPGLVKSGGDVTINPDGTMSIPSWFESLSIGGTKDNPKVTMRYDETKSRFVISVK